MKWTLKYCTHAVQKSKNYESKEYYWFKNKKNENIKKCTTLDICFCRKIKNGKNVKEFLGQKHKVKNINVCS